MPDITTQTLPDGSDGEIRLVAALTSMADENALFNAYSVENPAGIRFVERARNLGEVYDVGRQCRATVVLIDHQVSRDADAASLLVSVIQRMRHHPEHPILTFGVCYSPEWRKAFEDAGAMGTLDGPITPAGIAKLNDALPGALKRAYEERQSPNYVAHFSEAAVRLIDSGVWQRANIAVWSTKGGVGKSWIARELAVALGVLADRRTLLLDADMNCANQSFYLGVNANKNLFGLATVFAANGNRLSPLIIQQHLTPIGGNLSLLVGAYSMKLAGSEVLTGRQGAAFVNALLSALPAMGWDFVVWDLGQSFHHPMHLLPLQTCDTNLVVVTPEKATALELELALPDLRKEVEIDPRRFRLVVNRWDDQLGIDPKELTRRLGMPVFARIPYGKDRVVERSLNESKPLVLQTPNAVSDAIIGLTAGFYRPIETIWRTRGGGKAKRGGIAALFRR